MFFNTENATNATNPTIATNASNATNATIAIIAAIATNTSVGSGLHFFFYPSSVCSIGNLLTSITTIVGVYKHVT